MNWPLISVLFAGWCACKAYDRARQAAKCIGLALGGFAYLVALVAGLALVAERMGAL